MKSDIKQVTERIIKITRPDTGVTLWTAAKDGESIISYSRERVEQWLERPPLQV